MKLRRIYDTAARDQREGVCPYKGLGTFEASDAAYFFGREQLVGELAARTVGFGVLGVVGPSGCGKSSLVLAGLLPSLAAGLLPGAERWGHAVMRPGSKPIETLDSALSGADRGDRLVLVVDQFEEVFTGGADAAGPKVGVVTQPAVRALLPEVHQRGRQQGKPARLVLDFRDESVD